jgi:hypothetical protein
MPNSSDTPTAIVNSAATTTKLASRRCLACRLPDDLRGEIERDRVRAWATFAALAENLASKGFTLSESALRRHFRHVDKNRYCAPDYGSDGSAEPVSTPFDGLLTGWISEKAVAETLVRSLLERMQELERQQRAMRDPASRERLAGRHLQTLAALERALKRLEETRKPERDVKKIVAESLQRALEATMERYRAGMRDQMSALKQGAYDFLDQKLRPEEFLRQINRWEHEWPIAMATQIAETMILSFREAGAQV